MAAILEFQPDSVFLPGRGARPPLSVVPGPSARMQGVYRRRRVLAAILVLLLVLGVLVAGRTVAMAVAPSPPGAGVRSPSPVAGNQAVVVVQPGDTLWAIARRLQPDGDVRSLVDRLAQAHGSGPLLAGERLAVPDEAE